MVKTEFDKIYYCDRDSLFWLLLTNENVSRLTYKKSLYLPWYSTYIVLFVNTLYILCVCVCVSYHIYYNSATKLSSFVRKKIYSCD